jgi:hypothetical protein
VFDDFVILLIEEDSVELIEPRQSYSPVNSSNLLQASSTSSTQQIPKSILSLSNYRSVAPSNAITSPLPVQQALLSDDTLKQLIELLIPHRQQQISTPATISSHHSANTSVPTSPISTASEFTVHQLQHVTASNHNNKDTLISMTKAIFLFISHIIH